MGKTLSESDGYEMTLTGKLNLIASGFCACGLVCEVLLRCTILVLICAVLAVVCCVVGWIEDKP